MLSFSFWGDPEPSATKRIYELRTYTLKVRGQSSSFLSVSSSPRAISYFLKKFSARHAHRVGKSLVTSGSSWDYFTKHRQFFSGIFFVFRILGPGRFTWESRARTASGDSSLRSDRCTLSITSGRMRTWKRERTLVMPLGQAPAGMIAWPIRVSIPSLFFPDSHSLQFARVLSSSSHSVSYSSADPGDELANTRGQLVFAAEIKLKKCVCFHEFLSLCQPRLQKAYKILLNYLKMSPPPPWRGFLPYGCWKRWVHLLKLLQCMNCSLNKCHETVRYLSFTMLRFKRWDLRWRSGKLDKGDYRDQATKSKNQSRAFLQRHDWPMKNSRKLKHFLIGQGSLMGGTVVFRLRYSGCHRLPQNVACVTSSCYRKVTVTVTTNVPCRPAGGKQRRARPHKLHRWLFIKSTWCLFCPAAKVLATTCILSLLFRAVSFFPVYWILRVRKPNNPTRQRCRAPRKNWPVCTLPSCCWTTMSPSLWVFFGFFPSRFYDPFWMESYILWIFFCVL